jgi:hypothetical protein
MSDLSMKIFRNIHRIANITYYVQGSLKVGDPVFARQITSRQRLHPNENENLECHG